MTSLKSIACSLLLIAGVGLIAYPVFAHCGKCAADGKKIAAQLDQNKLTLANAVTAAEQHSKGRAIAVTSDLNEQGKLAIHVYCMAGDPPKIMRCHFCHVARSVIDMEEVHEFPITAGAHEREHASAKMIRNQTVEAGCGACIYKMPGVGGCPLAIKIDGKPYLVEGATWPNHDYCDRKCQALVTGTLEGDKFIASSVEPKQ